MPKKELIVFENTTAFEGVYPDVPFNDGVNVEELREQAIAGGMEKPMFATLPLAERNQVSRNGRLYDGDSLMAMMRGIHANEVTGQYDHDRRMQPAALRWVGATMEGDTLWGKAYVLPTSTGHDLYKEWAAAKSTSAKVGTSLYAKAYVEWDEELESYRVKDLELIRIDAVNPNQTGAEIASARPQLTETVDDEQARPASEKDTQDPDSGDSNEDTTHINQSGGDPMDTEMQKQDTADTPQKRLAAEKRALETELAAMQAQQEDHTVVVSELNKFLGESADSDVVLNLRALIAEVAKLRQENGALLENAIQDAAKLAAPTFEIAQDAIADKVRNYHYESGIVVEGGKAGAHIGPVTRHEVQSGIDTALAHPTIKRLLSLNLAEAMGERVPDTDGGNHKPVNRKPATKMIRIPGRDD